jgi:hypothetical protein
MKHLWSLLLFILSTLSLSGQVVFWNVENYFDPYDNPQTNDEDFTPKGDYHWTYSRFERKRDMIAKGIYICADKLGSMPSLIGLCEIENRWVLEQLVDRSILSKEGYEIIHRESPDRRGIDVALLYNPLEFTPLEEGYITISSFSTREILYTKGILNRDTIHVLVNHWPSKLGGESADSRRKMVAQTLLSAIDSIKNDKILIMGDFNDTPDSEVMEILISKGMVNSTSELASPTSGSLKYRGAWELIDQFVVSPGFEAIIEEVSIVDDPLFLERDKSYLGYKPYRTMIGPRYNGGFSDHLPIIMVLK